MLYRDFGRTGFRISALGFGSMRLPIPDNPDRRATADLDEAAAVIRRAVGQGVNYVDTGYFYSHFRSEVAVGLALAGEWRRRAAVATKLPVSEVKKRDDFKRIFEDQLDKLQTGWVDFYHFHAIGKELFDDVIRPLKLIEMAESFRDQGLIRHLSFSFHDSRPETMIELIDTGAFASVLCQYNLLDRSNEPGIAHAAAKGLGVAVMGPLGGGRLAFAGGVFEDLLGGKMTTPELALRFVLSNPGVSCALSGMADAAMVDANVATASQPAALSPAEMEAIDRISADCARLRELYCTGCGYCVKKGCPADINIPSCLESLIYHEVYRLDETAARHYAEIGESPWRPGKTAGGCIDCGACEKECPQKIPIRRRLQECLAVFGR